MTSIAYSLTCNVLSRHSCQYYFMHLYTTTLRFCIQFFIEDVYIYVNYRPFDLYEMITNWPIIGAH